MITAAVTLLRNPPQDESFSRNTLSDQAYLRLYQALMTGGLPCGWVVASVTGPAGFHHTLNLMLEPFVGHYFADTMREAPAKSGAKVDATY